MSYVVSIVSKPGMRPRTVSNDLRMDENGVRAMCAQMAQSMWRVNLHNVGDDGVISIVAAWEKGHRKRKVTTTLPLPVPQVIEGETTELPGEDEGILADSQAAQEALDAMHDDEQQTYNGYCVKCKEKRDFLGEVHVADSGRRMARGNCPVCGAGMSRILKNISAEEQESFDTPDDAPEPPSPVVVAFSDGEEIASAPAAAEAGN